MRNWLKTKLLRAYARIVREKARPEYIAKGWAIGMFVGCAVPFGFQLLISVPAAFLLKGSKIGAVAGTFVTNPLSIIFIYPAQCWVADHLLLSGNLSYSNLASVDWDMETVMQLGCETLEAFFLGGFLLAAVMTPLTYFAVCALVRRHRCNRYGK